MKPTLKEFLWVQAGIIFFVFVIMDCLIRGPMEIMHRQLDSIFWMKQESYRIQKSNERELKKMEVILKQVIPHYQDYIDDFNKLYPE